MILRKGVVLMNKSMVSSMDIDGEMLKKNCLLLKK